jgi:hypothetical protein
VTARRRAVVAGLAALALQRAAAAAAGTGSAPPPVNALRVGHGQKYLRIGDALKAARSGDIVEVESGDYMADVGIVDRDLIHVRGIGRRPRVIAAGASAENKATLLVRARGVVVENLEFVGARAPDHYGCGLRLESGSLSVRECRFTDNEIGLMTPGDPGIVLEIDRCEFSGLIENRNRGRALAHSLYVGAIDSLRVEGSYFHDGSIGHLLKSRARSSVIRYNRFTDQDGIASYEVEFPNGGLVELVGNLVQQGRRSENGTIVSFGAEGLRWKENRLMALFNTVVNDLNAAASFLTVHPQEAAATVGYNVLIGAGDLKLNGRSEAFTNVRAKKADFVDAGAFDYRPRIAAPWVGSASALVQPFAPDLLPSRQYLHVASTLPLPALARGGPLSPGAFQTVGR